mmetsp:Transcript_65026/g.173357  ORF Transcript_65026/g.173357 Transcript_65026/m.173357 type:complete len:222 (-) Transcript_65026:856-1521(-)
MFLAPHWHGGGHGEPQKARPGDDLWPGVSVDRRHARGVRPRVADQGHARSRHAGRQEQGHQHPARGYDQGDGRQQRRQVPLRCDLRQTEARAPQPVVRQGALRHDQGDADGPHQQLGLQAAHGLHGAQHVPRAGGVPAGEDAKVLLRRYQQRDLQLHPHHGANPLRRHDRRRGRGAQSVGGRGPVRQVQGLAAAGIAAGVLCGPYACRGEDSGSPQSGPNG